MHIYGIKNCDTVKKSIKWLNENKIDFEFHDFKKEAPSSLLVKQWFEKIDKNKLINKRGTTWRKLDDAQKAIEDLNGLIQLVVSNPSLLKRPVVQYRNTWSVGFDANEWQQQFTKRHD